MLRSIDLKVREKLKDKEFRRQWFRAQLEANVPDMFRTLREDRELTQQELAALADMKQSAISRFEKSDEANWKFETLLKLAEALDAQLVISLIKEEDVIAHYERREGGGSPKSSVLKAAAARPTRSEDALHLALPSGGAIFEALSPLTRSTKAIGGLQQRNSGIASQHEGRKAWN